jgi:hypothetical protein
MLLQVAKDVMAAMPATIAALALRLAFDHES